MAQPVETATILNTQQESSDTQTRKQTDATKCIISPASRSTMSHHLDGAQYDVVSLDDV